MIALPISSSSSEVSFGPSTCPPMVGFLITFKLLEASKLDDAVRSGSQASLATISFLLYLLLK